MSPIPSDNFQPRAWLISEICRFDQGSETPLRRAGLELRPIHTSDIFADPRFSPPDIYRREGICAVLAAPMLKENKLVGAIVLTRREPRPFTERQISYLPPSLIRPLSRSTTSICSRN